MFSHTVPHPFVAYQFMLAIGSHEISLWQSISIKCLPSSTSDDSRPATAIGSMDTTGQSPGVERGRYVPEACPSTSVL